MPKRAVVTSGAAVVIRRPLRSGANIEPTPAGEEPAEPYETLQAYRSRPRLAHPRGARRCQSNRDRRRPRTTLYRLLKRMSL